MASTLVRNEMSTCPKWIKVICAITLCLSIRRVWSDSHLSDKAKIAFQDYRAAISATSVDIHKHRDSRVLCNSYSMKIPGYPRLDIHGKQICKCDPKKDQNHKAPVQIILYQFKRTCLYKRGANVSSSCNGTCRKPWQYPHTAGLGVNYGISEVFLWLHSLPLRQWYKV